MMWQVHLYQPKLLPVRPVSYSIHTCWKMNVKSYLIEEWLWNIWNLGEGAINTCCQSLQDKFCWGIQELNDRSKVFPLASYRSLHWESTHFIKKIVYQHASIVTVQDFKITAARPHRYMWSNETTFIGRYVGFYDPNDSVYEKMSPQLWKTNWKLWKHWKVVKVKWKMS